MAKAPVTPVHISRYSGGSSNAVEDLVATEEPLEIRLKYYDGLDFREKRLAVTMRTPGNDFELAAGFLFTEGIIQEYSQVEKIFYCEQVKDPEETDNVVIVHLKADVTIDQTIFNRNFYVNSSCGVCGKSSLESIHTMCSVEFATGTPEVEESLIHEIPGIIRKDQSVFRYTGGLHASALLNTSGGVLLIREDIGRHNALDKLIGARCIQKSDNKDTILFVSGRAGFELVQKAVVAGIPIMVAVGAPSSLAVELARYYGLTLIGFARDNKFNIYSGEQRITSGR